MRQKTIDLVTAPKYKIFQIPVDQIIPVVQKLQGENLRTVYSKICGADALLKLKNNTDTLRRKICYALQKHQHGGLSVRHYNILYRLDKESPFPAMKDKFKPKSGTVLTRKWKGIEHHVYVRDNGFEYNGKTYSSLSKLAKVITGHERSGPVFFGLKKEGVSP